jgi:hypothetical protein
MYTPPLKPLEALPGIPPKSIMRSKNSPTKKLKFEVEFLDYVDVREYDITRVFKTNTTLWRKQDKLVRKALHSGTWKQSKGIFIHVASGTMLLESGFHAVLLSGVSWPPAKKPVRAPSSPPACASPPATARAASPRAAANPRSTASPRASNPARWFRRLHL